MNPTANPNSNTNTNNVQESYISRAQTSQLQEGVTLTVDHEKNFLFFVGLV